MLIETTLTKMTAILPNRIGIVFYYVLYKVCNITIGYQESVEQR